MGRLSQEFGQTLPPKTLNISSLVTFFSPRDLRPRFNCGCSWQLGLGYVKQDREMCLIASCFLSSIFPSHNYKNTISVEESGEKYGKGDRKASPGIQ